MSSNKEKLGDVEYKVRVYDSHDNLVEIYKTFSEEAKDELIECLFRDGPYPECFVTKKEVVQHIRKEVIEPDDV